jgi:hypothetical protein
VLIKPIIICFPALFIFFNYEKSRRLRAVSVHYILIALFIMPLTLRNYSIYHEFIPISLNSSVNLFIGNNPYANGTYIYDEKVLSLIGNPGDELTESKRAQRYAVDYIKEHPVRALVLLPRKIYYQYITDVDGISSNLAGVPLEAGATRMFLKASRIVAQAVYVFIVALFFISLYRMIQGAGISAVLKRPPIIVILYFFIMYLPFFGAPRFHYVMMPFILMVAAAQLPKKLVANLKNIFIRRGVVLSS